MNMPFAVHDVVTAAVAVPATGGERAVREGQQGVVLEVLAGPTYLVEFADEKGRTLATPFMAETQLAAWEQPSRP